MKLIIFSIFALLVCTNALMPIEIDPFFTEEPPLHPNQGDIICFSNNADGSNYFIGNNMWAMGRITLDGTYTPDGLFEPIGFAGKDISAEQKFKDLCNRRFAPCKNGCWAGGETVAPKYEKGDILCFSHIEQNSQYSIGGDMWVMGRVTLDGTFSPSGTFEPKGYAGQDISSAQEMKDTCNNQIPSCQGQCWAGGAKKAPTLRSIWGSIPRI